MVKLEEVLVEAHTDGYSQIIYPDGRLYDGDISRGKRHGFGRLIHPDLGVFDGSWNDGKMGESGVFEVYYSDAKAIKLRF